MSATKLGGNRIKDKSIQTKHLSEDIVLKESNLQLTFPTHDHPNKAIIDVFSNSAPEAIHNLDIFQIVQVMNDVIAARAEGQNLRNTILSKADGAPLQLVINEVAMATGNNASLAEAMRVAATETADLLSTHIGAIGHQNLDHMFEDYVNAIGDFPSLAEALSNAGGSGSGGGGSINVNMLTPWTAEIIVPAGQKEITLPETYTPGKNNLQVFEGPTLLTPGVDYLETTTSLITLIDAFDFNADIKIFGTNTGRLFEWVMYINVASRTTKIPTIDRYKPGEKDIVVYEDGLLLTCGIDYTEGSTTEITIPGGMLDNCNIAIFKRRL